MIATKLVVSGLVAVAGVGGTSSVLGNTASAATTNNANNSSSSTAAPAKPHDGGKIVTNKTVIARVTAAVRAKYPKATVDRVAKLPNGSYLAFSRKANDRKVIVTLSSSYTITRSNLLPANAPDGAKGKPPKAGTPPSARTSS